MSSFNCDQCNASCIDTKHGYISGCEHYQADKKAIDYYIDVFLNKQRSYDNLRDWMVGKKLYNGEG